MALALWPAAAGWLDDVGRVRLAAAYWRRQRLEARLIAVEIGRLFAGKSARQPRVSVDDLLGELGA